MGYWSDWYEKNAGKETCLTNAEFVLKTIDKFITDVFNLHKHTKSDITDFAHSHTVSDITDLYNKIYPVGSIYMSVNNTNPGSYLAGTTWAAWGSGRVPVGVDIEQTEFDVVEKPGGKKEHTLTVDEIPAHTHNYSLANVSTDSHRWNDSNDRGIVHNSSTTSSTGGNGPHNNLQPYITCYMWKRTV
jgi:hypothetical protein